MNLFNLVSPIYEKVISGNQATFEALFKLGDFKKTDRVLDLGGGTGRIAKFFVGKVEEIVVLDVSKGMISQCQKHQGINCVLGKAERIPFGDGFFERSEKQGSERSEGSYFDKMIIVDAFHHFRNQKIAVQEIRRVLKENGRVIIEEVNFGRLGNWLVEKLETIFGSKSKILSAESLSQLFSEKGFRTKLFDKKGSGYYLTAEK